VSGPRQIKEMLQGHFGVPEVPQKRSVMDELIMTILSQNTTDINRNRAFQALKARYRSWHEILESSPEELAEVIRPAGLAPTKSRRIWNILENFPDGKGSFLDRICDLPGDEALLRLKEIKGVGPKTAACVLLFSCGMPAFPVDTHVYRVCGRMGLLEEGTGRDKAHQVLSGYFHPEDYLEVHLNLIQLGRKICRPKKPGCQLCPFGDMCPSSNSL